MTWAVWKVYYMTYAEIAAQGDKPRELIARLLTRQIIRRLRRVLFAQCHNISR